MSAISGAGNLFEDLVALRLTVAMRATFMTRANLANGTIIESF
jgi:hypothetical protein